MSKWLVTLLMSFVSLSFSSVSLARESTCNTNCVAETNNYVVVINANGYSSREDILNSLALIAQDGVVSTLSEKKRLDSGEFEFTFIISFEAPNDSARPASGPMPSPAPPSAAKASLGIKDETLNSLRAISGVSVVPLRPSAAARAVVIIRGE